MEGRRADIVRMNRLHTALFFFCIIVRSSAFAPLCALCSLYPSLRASHMKGKVKVVREHFFTRLYPWIYKFGCPLLSHFYAAQAAHPNHLYSTFLWKHFSPSSSASFLLHTSPAELHGLTFRSTGFGPMKEKREKQEVPNFHCFLTPCGMLAIHW